MGRPRKPEHEKLVVVSTCLSPREAAAIDRVAESRGVSRAHLIRVILTKRIDYKKTDTPDSSLTL